MKPSVARSYWRWFRVGFFSVDPHFQPPQLYYFCLEGTARAVKSLSSGGFCTAGKRVNWVFLGQYLSCWGKCVSRWGGICAVTLVIVLHDCCIGNVLVRPHLEYRYFCFVPEGLFIFKKHIFKIGKENIHWDSESDLETYTRIWKNFNCFSSASSLHTPAPWSTGSQEKSVKNVEISGFKQLRSSWWRTILGWKPEECKDWRRKPNLKVIFYPLWEELCDVG